MGTPNDGHGHHQFTGYLTPLAFEAAADPDRYPEQLEAGLLPWQTDKLYVSVRRPETGLLVINTGEHDLAAGRSYFEIGMHGRSQQKSQQMGSLELRGRQESRLRLVEATTAAVADETSVFDGIDTTIRGIAGFESEQNPDLERHLGTTPGYDRRNVGAVPTGRSGHIDTFISVLPWRLRGKRKTQRSPRMPVVCLNRRSTRFNTRLSSPQACRWTLLPNRNTDRRTNGQCCDSIVQSGNCLCRCDR